MKIEDLLAKCEWRLKIERNYFDKYYYVRLFNHGGSLDAIFYGKGDTISEACSNLVISIKDKLGIDVEINL